MVGIIIILTVIGLITILRFAIKKLDITFFKQEAKKVDLKEDQYEVIDIDDVSAADSKTPKIFSTK